MTFWNLIAKDPLSAYFSSGMEDQLLGPAAKVREENAFIPCMFLSGLFHQLNS